MLVLLRHSSCSLLIKVFDSEMHQTTAYIIFSEPLHLCMRKKNFCLSIFRVVCNCFHDIYFTCMKNNLSYIYSSLNVPLFQTNISHSQIQIKYTCAKFINVHELVKNQSIAFYEQSVCNLSAGFTSSCVRFAVEQVISQSRCDTKHKQFVRSQSPSQQSYSTPLCKMNRVHAIYD